MSGALKVICPAIKAEICPSGCFVAGLARRIALARGAAFLRPHHEILDRKFGQRVATIKGSVRRSRNRPTRPRRCDGFRFALPILLAPTQNRSGEDLHGRDCARSARKASRATPTAASSLSDVRTGTPSMVARIRLQIRFAAPPPTVVTQVGCGPPNSARRR